MALRMIDLEEGHQPTYHGMPVLTMHVGDPVPTTRAPERYAVHVGPDLARYLLTFNHPENRSLKPRKIRAMATDMVANRYMLSPQSPIFDTTPHLINGQNTLHSIVESGCMVWVVLDFGWPPCLMDVIDRVTTRNNNDTLHFAHTPNPALVAAMVTRVWQYERMVGTTRSLSGMDVPTSPEVLELVRDDAEAYQEAARHGKRVYDRLDKGGAPSLWGSAYYLIAKAHPATCAAFFDEIAEESGEPRSATRELARWFHRRPLTGTRTADSREPLELVIRGFNAWTVGKSLAFPKQKAFPFSRIRKP